MPNYHAGRDERLYGYHFWGYSLAGVPARRLLESRGLSPLRALPVTNALLFGLALVAVAFLPSTGARRLALGGLLLLSPALGFLMWPHPEVFTFALVMLALVLAARGGHAAAVLAAALASLQNPPLVLLVALLWAAAALAAWRRRSATPVLLGTLAALPALLPAVFFQWQFGVFNLSVRPSEAAESLSALRALDLAVDPNLGLLPHAPLTLLLAVVGALAALRRRRATPALLVFVLLPLLAFACTANSNSEQATRRARAARRLDAADSRHRGRGRNRGRASSSARPRGGVGARPRAGAPGRRRPRPGRAPRPLGLSSSLRRASRLVLDHRPSALPARAGGLGRAHPAPRGRIRGAGRLPGRRGPLSQGLAAVAPRGGAPRRVRRATGPAGGTPASEHRATRDEARLDVRGLLSAGAKPPTSSGPSSRHSPGASPPRSSHPMRTRTSSTTSWPTAAPIRRT